MDRIPLTTTATAADSWYDLEGAVVDSRASASLVEIVIEDILANDDHPTIQAPEGRRILVLDEARIEALNHAITNLVLSTRKAADVFYAAHAAKKAGA